MGNAGCCCTSSIIIARGLRGSQPSTRDEAQGALHDVLLEGRGTANGPVYRDSCGRKKGGGVGRARSLLTWQGRL